MAGLAKTSRWVTTVMQRAVAIAGTPKAILSDNGTEFGATWEDSLTPLGCWLDQQASTHLSIAPYYPQANGKAEAFIKTLRRTRLQEPSYKRPWISYCFIITTIAFTVASTESQVPRIYGRGASAQGEHSRPVPGWAVIFSLTKDTRSHPGR